MKHNEKVELFMIGYYSRQKFSVLQFIFLFQLYRNVTNYILLISVIYFWLFYIQKFPITIADIKRGIKGLLESFDKNVSDLEVKWTILTCHYA